MTARGMFVSVACAVLAGCSQLSPPPVIDAGSARAAIEDGLGIRLAAVPPIESTSSFANVEAAYSGETINERLLVVAFDSREATVQFTGGRALPARGEAVLVEDNLVVVYAHDEGTISRLSTVRAALRRLGAATSA